MLEYLWRSPSLTLSTSLHDGKAAAAEAVPGSRGLAGGPAGTGMAVGLSWGQLQGTGFHPEGKVELLLWHLLMLFVPDL